jgi:hypothetical protein
MLWHENNIDIIWKRILLNFHRKLLPSLEQMYIEFTINDLLQENLKIL